MLVLNLPAFEHTHKKTQPMAISMEMVRMAKSRTRKNQSERSDLHQDYLSYTDKVTCCPIRLDYDGLSERVTLCVQFS